MKIEAIPSLAELLAQSSAPRSADAWRVITTAEEAIAILDEEREGGAYRACSADDPPGVDVSLANARDDRDRIIAWIVAVLSRNEWNPLIPYLAVGRDEDGLWIALLAPGSADEGYDAIDAACAAETVTRDE